MRLLTFLGTGKYQEVPYRLNGVVHSTSLCPVAISRILTITDIVVFVTNEARDCWYDTFAQEAAAFGAKCRPVEIQLPADEAGMWDLFRAVQGEMGDTPVVLDVTHAFRAIPLVVMVAAGFARARNPEALKAVYYGAYEARDSAGVAPIIELTGLVSLLDWTAAVAVFRRYGDASAITELMDPTRRQLGSAGMTHAAGELGKVASHLRSASNNLLACRPRSAPKAASAARAAIAEHAATTAEHSPAFHAVRDMLMDALAAIAVDPGIATRSATLGAHMEMVQWYAEHRHPLHALAMAREWLVTAVCMLNGFDWTAREKRQDAEKLMNDRKAPDELVSAYDTISQWRNDVLHCGMRESQMPASTVLDNVATLHAKLEPLIKLVPEEANP